MLQDIPPRESGRGRVHVVIDTPAGSRNKYRYDEQLGIFRISRVLPQGAVFPYDFGFIPGTRAEDGDALDVLVLQFPASFPGCLATVRLIGVLHAEQRDGRAHVVYFLRGLPSFADTPSATAALMSPPASGCAYDVVWRMARSEAIVVGNEPLAVAACTPALSASGVSSRILSIACCRLNDARS